MTIHRIVLNADQVIHAGVGKGSGFSRTSYPFVPASTLRGALSAVWWLNHPGSSQSDFDARIANVSFTDAVPTLNPQQVAPAAVALDRMVCRVPHDAAPSDCYGPSVLACPLCGRATEQSKGIRLLPKDAELRTSTRVTLTPNEQALDENLFERQGLDARSVHLVALAAGDPAWLVGPGTTVRVGAASTVAGRVTVTAVEPLARETLTLAAGRSRLRLELMTPGVFVDDFGRARSEPTARDIRVALSLPSDVDVHVERSFVRWGAVGGWHVRANRPKPEDPAIIAHSCYYLVVSARSSITVPAVTATLGLRTTEGCGWAQITELKEVSA